MTLSREEFRKQLRNLMRKATDAHEDSLRYNLAQLRDEATLHRVWVIADRKRSFEGWRANNPPKDPSQAADLNTAIRICTEAIDVAGQFGLALPDPTSTHDWITTTADPNTPIAVTRMPLEAPNQIPDDLAWPPAKTAP